MKNKNKQLVLTLTLSSLLLVGCATNSETKTDPIPAISTKLAVLAESVSPSISVPKTNVQPIDDATAKATALTHADVSDSDASFVRVKLDVDDGRQVYDVEFYDSNYNEYDYEIDALTGEVLDFDWDAEDFVPLVKEETTISSPTTSAVNQQDTSTPSIISDQQAKEIAAAQVPGATIDNIREFEADRDDGRLTYEGSLRYNYVEYDFEIDGASGTILSWEIDD